ncbi:MAG TPA: hypothetical protein DIW43_07160 [Spongiibacteraceae bacterium]|nr:hypothetical protein [Spongiibacteraceae bacterium]HCS27215.1 hypothetical protein [Spongiibacteraceae bacterium]
MPVIKLVQSLILCLSALLGHAGQAFACSCIWQGNFAEIDKSGATIVLGKVLSHKGNSMDLQVHEVLQGKLYREEIRIWGEVGSLCRAELSNFADGSEWLLVLDTITTVPDKGFNPNTPNISFGRKDDFSLKRCGVYWLEHHNGYLRGNVDDDKRWLYLDKKKSPVSLELIRRFLAGKLDKSLIAEAAKTPTKKGELLTDTKVFLLQQQREERLRERLENLEPEEPD